ncbi:hypothetical protein GGR56DRAFT_595080 [Xylariaceae sp. FL0804]|nr:hypothetical protein GGR56DRAFT_595080 [Xylariaceae sp. FL0804]
MRTAFVGRCLFCVGAVLDPTSPTSPTSPRAVHDYCGNSIAAVGEMVAAPQSLARSLARVMRPCLCVHFHPVVSL